MFCSVKDKIPTHQKSNVIYTIKCSGCGEDYIGKTVRCVITTLYQLPDIDNDFSTVNLQAHIASAVSDNWKILDFNTNWAQLCFLESLYIKRLKLMRG